MNKETLRNIIIVIVGILITSTIYFSMKINQLRMDINELSCDLISGFNAERKYTYPILREQGYNPDNYGRGIFNPILSKEKYFTLCNK